MVAMLALALLAACSSTVVRSPGATSAPKASTPKPGASIVVQRGDTLYRLAVSNGISPMDLALWNNIAAPYTIYPGQSLRLFPGSGSSRPPTATATTTAAVHRRFR